MLSLCRSRQIKRTFLTFKLDELTKRSIDLYVMYSLWCLIIIMSQWSWPNLWLGQTQCWPDLWDTTTWHHHHLLLPTSLVNWKKWIKFVQVVFLCHHNYRVNCCSNFATFYEILRQNVIIVIWQLPCDILWGSFVDKIIEKLSFVTLKRNSLIHAPVDRMGQYVFGKYEAFA